MVIVESGLWYQRYIFSPLKPDIPTKGTGRQSKCVSLPYLTFHCCVFPIRSIKISLTKYSNALCGKFARLLTCEAVSMYLSFGRGHCGDVRFRYIYIYIYIYTQNRFGGKLSGSLRAAVRSGMRFSCDSVWAHYGRPYTTPFVAYLLVCARIHRGQLVIYNVLFSFVSLREDCATAEIL